VQIDQPGNGGVGPHVEDVGVFRHGGRAAPDADDLVTGDDQHRVVDRSRSVPQTRKMNGLGSLGLGQRYAGQ
jgi:hypothetical protein